MGREIRFKLTATRPFMTREVIEAEQFVLAFNQLFKDAGRGKLGLLNFCVYGNKPEAYELFLDGHGEGITKPFGDDAAALLYAGLVGLSKVLPSAWIEVRDEGGFGSSTLGNGLLQDMSSPAKAMPAGIPVADLNELLPSHMRPVESRSPKGHLTPKQFSALVTEVERVTRLRMSEGALSMADFFQSIE